MPTPATAPPSVMVFNCGTTAGMTPRARHSRTRSSYVIMPSASTEPPAGSTARTWLKARTSSRRRGAASRSRNRFDVSFASPTGPAAAAPDALSRAARASFFSECCERGLLVKFVEVAARERVARHRDVALREHHLEEMRAAARRAEHLGAAVEVHAPDAPEALVEALRVEPADLVPVAVEALGPHIQGERVVAPQVLDVQHFQPGPLHLDDHIGEARDPAAGKYVLADEVISLEMPDMADEMDEAEAAGLERAGVRADQVHQTVAAGVLEAADRNHLVVLAVHRAEIRFQCHGVLQPPLRDLAARVLDLRAGGVVAGDFHAEALFGIEQETAEAAADVDHIVAGLEQHLLADVIELVALRFLERARALLPVRAGVEHQRIVEPVAIELGPERVMELGVVLGAHPARVRMQELVPAVRKPYQQRRLLGARCHARGQRAREAPFEVDLAIEI